MAITRIGAASGTNTATMPTHAAGDLIIVAAYRDGSTTLPTVPSGLGWVESVSGSSNSNGMRVYLKIAASSGETVGTWANATTTMVAVYRADGTIGVGVSSAAGGTATSIPFNGLASMQADGTSWVLGIVGHRSTNTNLAVAPSGMTNFLNPADATDEGAMHDTNGAVSSWSTTNASVGGTSSGYRSATVEITEAPPPPTGGLWLDQSVLGTDGGASTGTVTGLDIGVADAGRWVIAGIVTSYNGGSAVTAVAIGGVSATQLAQSSGLSPSVAFFAANVPTGTTADVAVTYNGNVFDTAVATAPIGGEPTLFAAAYDATLDSLSLGVSLDIPASGSILALAKQNFTGSTASWSGVAEDFENTVNDFYGASATGLGAETGRGVSVTYASGGFVDLAFGAISFTLAGGGGTEITGSGAATLPSLAAGGAGARSVTGAGAATLLAAGASGNAERVVTGAGAATLGEITSAGTGERAVTGVGAATLGEITSVGAGARVVVATGAVSLAAVTAAGAGTRTVTGVGAVTLPPVTASGAPAQNVTGTGSVLLPAADATGAALRQANGSGAVTLPAGQVNGAATREITGAGAADLPAPVAAGAGARAVSSVGAATLPAATGAGGGTRAVTGTSEASLPAVEAAGAAIRTVTGSGAATFPATAADGLAGVNGALTAAGDVTLPAAAASGAGTRTVTGSGIVLLPPANVNAAVTREIVGSGVVTLPPATAFGSSGAAANITGSGAATLPPADATGAGAREVSGTGAAELPPADGAGAATRAVTGSGAGVLPGLDTAGSGARGVSGAGAVVLSFVGGAGAAGRQINGAGAVSLPSLMAMGSEAVLSGRRAALVGAPANRGSVVPRDTGSLVIAGNNGRVVQTSGGGSLAGSRGKGRLT